MVDIEEGQDTTGLDVETTIEDEVLEEIGEELESDIEEGMHKDDFFTVLSNNRRRTLFRYMNVNSDDAPFRIGEVSEVIAAQENDKQRRALTSEERKRVYVALYQSHLPDIDNKGLIDFNSDRGLIDFPEDGNEYVFESINKLLDDEMYPRDQVVDEEYFERVFGDDESYLSKLRQHMPF